MKKVLLMLSLFSALSMCACERAEGSTGEAAQESPEGGTVDYDENYTYEGIEVWSESHGGNGLWSLMTSTAYHNPGLYQRDRIVHSETGRQLAEAILFAERYSGVSDAALREFLHQKGLAFEVNATGGERWLLFAPHAPKDEQIPVVQVFTPASLYGMSMYYRLIELAAQGEFMLVMLGIESGSKVSLVPQIVDELAGRFPIDEGRIYSVGHSHYGAFAQQLASAYPSRTAGIAQLSGYFGCMNGASEAWRGMDMPVINVIGYAEMNSPVPMNTDAPAIDQIPSRYQQLFPMTKERRIKTWQDRLYELNCEVATTEQMEAASTGSEVERTLGFPVARGATVRAYGMDYYIGDLTNSSGRSHARFAVMDNFPHSASPYELDLTWHFLKRFARDTATGACIERYQSDALYPEPEGEPSAQENYTWSTRQQNVTARDGSTTIQGELFLPDRQGKMPLVIFSHEFLQTHASGTPYGEYFAAKGIATYAFDFTNGASNGRSDFTKVSGLTETHDLEDVLAAARQWDFVDSDRIILVGASFGCWATAVCGIDHQDAVAGMVLLYPGLRFLEDIESRFHDPGDVPETWDFHGTTLGRCYVTDIWGYDIYAEMAKYAGKVLVLNGNADPAISVAFAQHVADCFPDAEFTVIPGGRHGFTGAALDIALQRIWQYVSQVIQSATSGISSTKASHHQAGAPSSSNHSVYTLNGRRLLSNAQNLSHLQRGVYIVNGQKTIIQ